MSNHRTSAKSKDTPKPEKWVSLLCPVCGAIFPYGGAQYRYLKKQGKEQLCCSRKCGAEMRWRGVPA